MLCHKLAFALVSLVKKELLAFAKEVINEMDGSRARG